MKHYLFYIHSLAGGGAEKLTLLLMNRLVRTNRVSLAVNLAKGPLRDMVSEDISLHELKPASNPAAVVRFASLLQKTQPDHIHCRIALCPLIGVLGALLTRNHRKVTIAYDSLFFRGGRFGARLTRYSVFFLSRLSHGTVCVSADILQELRDRFKADRNKLTVIHNPVDLADIRDRSQDPFPARLRIYQRDRPFILSAGRLVTQKDFPTLLRAFQRLHKHIPHDLILLGQGPLAGELDGLARKLGIHDRVVFPGFLPNPFPLFRKASLFVLSSSLEGFGNVLVEALALGTPVVSTDCPGGPKEILAGGEYGKLVPVGSDSRLAAAMEETLRSPLPSQILQCRAKNFSLEKITIQYQRLFSQINPR